jgi:hypothetical protein
MSGVSLPRVTGKDADVVLDAVIANSSPYVGTGLPLVATGTLGTDNVEMVCEAAASAAFTFPIAKTKEIIMAMTRRIEIEMLLIFSTVPPVNRLITSIQSPELF